MSDKSPKLIEMPSYSVARQRLVLTPLRQPAEVYESKCVSVRVIFLRLLIKYNKTSRIIYLHDASER
jgi:hypothetical protein